MLVPLLHAAMDMLLCHPEPAADCGLAMWCEQQVHAHLAIKTPVGVMLIGCHIPGITCEAHTSRRAVCQALPGGESR